MATTTRRITTSSSTSSSGAICGTSIRCSDSRCPRSCSPATSARATCRCRSSPPVGLLNPVLDGRATSYFEWLPAGIVETDAPSGTMTGGEHRDPELRTLLFGFDLEHLYLRLDLNGPAAQRLAQGLRCSVSFTTPADRRLVIKRLTEGRSRGAASEGARTALGAARAAPRPKVAAAEILEAVHPVRGPRSPAQQPVRVLRDDSQRARSSSNATRPTGPSRASSRSLPSKS